MQKAGSIWGRPRAETPSFPVAVPRVPAGPPL